MEHPRGDGGDPAERAPLRAGNMARHGRPDDTDATPRDPARPSGWLQLRSRASGHRISANPSFVVNRLCQQALPPVAPFSARRWRRAAVAPAHRGNRRVGPCHVPTMPRRPVSASRRSGRTRPSTPKLTGSASATRAQTAASKAKAAVEARIAEIDARANKERAGAAHARTVARLGSRSPPHAIIAHPELANARDAEARIRL